jgi:AcrR family transcriptional regulator
MGRPQDDPPEDAGRRLQALRAAKAAIAERGLSGLRMADIAKFAHMSPGHILYYFKSKNDLLIQTLLWNEGELAAQRRAELAAIESACGRLGCFIDRYLPQGMDDPNWDLWLAGYGLVMTDQDIYMTVADVLRGWHDDLTNIVRLGIRRGEFRAVDADDFAEHLDVLLLGYAIHLVTGDPRYDRELVVTRVAAAAAAELGVDADRLRAV